MADQLISVSLSDLHRSPDNMREDFGNIPLLAKSIDEQGMIEPIIVRKREEGGYFIVAGERRSLALKHLSKKKADVLLREYTREEAFLVTVSENAHRESFNAIELAASFAKMQAEFGYSGDIIAQRLKLKSTQVYDLLGLNKHALEPLKKAITSGKLGAQAGVQVARVQGERLQATALADALKLAKDGEQPSLRAVKKLIQDRYLTKGRFGLTKKQKETRLHGAGVHLRRKVVSRLLTRVGELVERKHHLDETDLRTMALAHAEASPSEEATREVFERRGIKPAGLAKVGAAQLRSLVVELALAPLVALDAGGNYSKGTKAVARVYALSLSELEKNVEAETAAEALFEK